MQQDSHSDPALPLGSTRSAHEADKSSSPSVTIPIAGISWTEAELEQRHADIVARFPGGLSHAEFRYLTLESAREDERVHAPSVAPLTLGFSMLVGMLQDGLIENRGGGYHKPFKWCITDKGRAVLAQGIEAQRAETALAGSVVDESPTPQGDALKPSSES